MKPVYFFLLYCYTCGGSVYSQDISFILCHLCTTMGKTEIAEHKLCAIIPVSSLMQKPKCIGENKLKNGSSGSQNINTIHNKLWKCSQYRIVLVTYCCNLQKSNSIRTIQDRDRWPNLRLLQLWPIFAQLCAERPRDLVDFCKICFLSQLYASLCNLAPLLRVIF